MRGLIAAAILALMSTAQAQDEVAAFYKDKQIKLMVGAGAGSGYDIGARVLVRYLGKYIPGNPTFIVQNQVGAASMIMTNAVYNTAPRDGTVIGAAINGMPTGPLFEPDAARFDPNKIIWLGSVNREVQVNYVWHTSPVLKLQDLFKTEMVVGATSPGTSQVDFPLVARAVLGLKYKVISGYEGTAQIHKAMEAGEVHGVGSTAYASLRAINQNWLDDGRVKIVAQWGMKKHPELPNVPAILDLAKNPADREALELIVARLEYGRPYFLPPDVPPARVAALRKAFDLTMKDPGFIAESQKLNLEIDPMTGEELAALVRKVNATSPAVVARVKEALRNK
jgi:tripartite-type tricarboxylate transporter receptor subunit TctC